MVAEPTICVRGEGRSLRLSFVSFFGILHPWKGFFGYSFVFSWYLGVSCVQPLLAIREAMRCSLTMPSLSDGFHPKQKCLSLAVIRRVRICWIDSSINMGSRQIDNSTNGAGRSKRKAFDLGEKEIKTFLWCSQACEIKRKHLNLWLFHVKRHHNSAKKMMKMRWKISRPSCSMELTHFCTRDSFAAAHA